MTRKPSGSRPDAVVSSGETRIRRAIGAIPAGETRTFAEVAALAGRPGSQRAVGAAAARCPSAGPVPWHRVVSAGGGLSARRATLQLRRLRADNARPGAREAVTAWAGRSGARWIGNLATRAFARASDPRIADWPPRVVERLPSAAVALARGLLPLDEAVSALPLSRAPRRTSRAASRSIEERIAGLDGDALRTALITRGFARAERLLAPAECAALVEAFGRDELFERTIDMAPRGFGVGSYRYFREPPLALVERLRGGLYAKLVPIARDVVAGAGSPPAPSFPDDVDTFLVRCRESGQERGSSIVLRYGMGGINHPHQDIYGPVWFPFQALVVLDRRGVDFRGGSFVLIDERPGGRERRTLVHASEGELVVFCSRSRGPHRTPVRHGMTLVTRGSRHALGVVFHLAR